MDADELYGLPLEEFTQERDALARGLRADGRRDEAAAVAALRKPTLAAWAVNQLARRHRREVDLLLDASRRLVDAQTGGRAAAEIAEATTRQRRTLSDLGRLAASVLGDRATPATTARVSDTLRSASLTDEGRELLARGTLVQELTTTGWEIVEAVGALPPAPAATPSRKPSERSRLAAERRARVAEAKERLAAAREAAATAARLAAEAEAEVDRLEIELGEAAGAAAAARDAAEAAATRVADAEAELARAREAGA